MIAITVIFMPIGYLALQVVVGLNDDDDDNNEHERQSQRQR